jgi:GNAT superfamily N-acetyltransferase
MSSLEIHPLSDLREEAAALLSERFARQRAAEPLLPEIEDFAAQLPEEGHVATRGGEAVAYLAGAVDEETQAARWLFAGHAAREPEALRDLFALQAEQFHVTRFVLAVAATDPALVDIWFRLAFGCQAIWAVREVEPAEPVDFGGSIRPATPADAEAILGFEEALYTHQTATPSFSGLKMPPVATLQQEVAEIWDDDSYIPFVAESEGHVTGMLGLYHRPQDDLRVPSNNIDLAFAVTTEEARGRGTALALTAHAMSWAYEQGFASMTVDWRSVNLLSSRFWPKRGFRPQYLRLYRAVP